MNTGYFAKLKSYKSMGYNNFISIARFNRYYNGRIYKKLAPPSFLLQIEDEKIYAEQYKKLVLDKLDAKQVYEELGENAVLLCYEKYDDIKKHKTFCHRILVANWLMENIEGLEIKEIDDCDKKSNQQLSFKID